MALSGNFTGTTSNQYVQPKITWSATQSVSGNYSDITATLTYSRTNTGYTTSGTWRGSITINGVTTSGSLSGVSITYNSNTEVLTATTRVEHNSDGAKSISISAEGSISGASLTYTTVSSTITLDTIPRAATITSAVNFSDEGQPKVKYSNPAGTAAAVSIGLFWDSAGTDALIAYSTVTDTSGIKDFTLTTAQKNAIYSKMANVKSTTIYYRIKTVIGSNTYTSNVAKTVTITNATPTLSPTAVEDTDSATDEDGAYNVAATGSNMRWVKGYSDIRYAFNATAKKGATIKSYLVECGSKSATTSTGALYNIDSNTVKFTVTDSRGNTATKTITGTLVDYIKLTCSLSATAALDTSTTAKATIKISGNFFNGELKAGTKNTLTTQYRYKEAGGDYGSWVSVSHTISGNSYTVTYTVPTSLDYQKSYTFQTRAQDGFYSAYNKYVVSNEIVVKALPVFDWGENDFKFNVPVNFQNSLYMKKNDLKVYGYTTDGEAVQVIDTCSVGNNLTLGYGLYDAGIGNTHIYGNSINLYTNNDFVVNGLSLLGAAKAMTYAHSLDATCVSGSNYSSTKVSNVELISNTLRVFVSATRSEDTTGNITNEKVMTITLKHNGKIRNMYNISIPNGSTGATASLYTENIVYVDDNTLTFDIMLAATVTATSGFSSFFDIPVTLNLAAFL